MATSYLNQCGIIKGVLLILYEITTNNKHWIILKSQRKYYYNTRGKDKDRKIKTSYVLPKQL